jgi:AraC family transcriptional regulator, regulatory protein of adaptative response / DNA-3-methyladenine glycosylase II
VGEALPASSGGLTHLFPSPAALAQADLDALPGPRRRRQTLRALAAALAAGEIVPHPGSDREEVRTRLLALDGIGPWTADYIAMRALADPDAFLASDLGVRHALHRLGQPADPKAATALAERWRPWRAYAVQHLWASLPSTGVQ